MERRKFVRTTGVAAVGLVTAGCLGGETDETTQTSTERSTESNTEQPAEGSTATGESNEEIGDLDIDGRIGDTPEHLEVTGQELYRTNGEVGVRGTVENTGDQPYESVEVAVVLHDDAGDVLVEFIDEKEEEETGRLDAGGTWEFDVVFEEAQLSEVTEYEVNLDGDLAQTAGDEGSAAEELDIDGEIGDDTDPDFEITSHAFQRAGETAQVSGTIENTGNETAQSVEVSVTLYDAQDNEIDVFTNSTEEEEDISELAPDETWDFTVQFSDVDMQNVGRYVVSVDSDII
ncbi:FxLYD domain-containing protein [Salinigranum sp. GCM10025319]|uniref:FxLYD domain-containing protein n=1 Tax=Salinigranum sp. GCM10025319 TaxID=3252687 RepID=UPI0036149850